MPTNGVENGGNNTVADIIRRKLVVAALNIPPGTTSQQVSELLWARCGLHADPADISTQDSGKYSATAFISIDETSLVDFLNRNFETCTLGEQRGPIKFETKLWKEEQNRPSQQATIR
jgi:hypothetical protein